MSEMTTFLRLKRKPPIVGIMGSHREDSPALGAARSLGEAVAARGHVLLTGGGTGVMAAASEGAWRAGGLVLAILPNERNRPLEGYPNRFVDLAVYTGLSDGRNAVSAKTSHVMIALEGGPGTLSEIALALKSGTPVIGLRAPRSDLEKHENYHAVSSVSEALECLDRLLPPHEGGHLP